jgi:hypothetical protein
MRLPSLRFKIRGLAVVATVMAVLVGGLILLLRDSAPTETSVPPRPNSGYVIMEGVDINSNGPLHSISGLPFKRQRLLPPEHQSGERQ